MTSSRGQYSLEFLLCAGFALLAWLAAADFATPLPLYRYGADGWPKAIALGLSGSATLLLLYRLIFTPEEAEAFTPVEQDAQPVSKWRKAVVFAIPMLYAVLLPYIGFYVATFLFLPLYTRLLGEKRILRLLLVTCCTAVCIVVLFSKYLYVPFPVGSLPLFYDINSFISELMYM